MGKIQYKIEMTLGILGGLILFITGAVGSAQTYLLIIDMGKIYVRLSEELANLLANIFIALAIAGGLTVIVGAFFIGFGRRRIGSWLVGIGAGISLSTLLIKIYLLGPIIADLIRNGQFYDAAKIFGVELGLVGLGVVLSFFSTLTNYRWMIYTFILSILNLYIGVTANPELIDLLVSKLSIPESIQPYIYQLELLVAYVGLLFLIITFIVGANHFKISKFLAILAIISLMPSFVIMIITTASLLSSMTLLEELRVVLQTINIIAIGYFILKAKTVHEENKERKKKGKYYQTVEQ